MHRKDIFMENLTIIIKAMDELCKIGVSHEEISEFLYNWMHEKTIFEGKLTYDFKNSTFTHESNYPVHLEYYQHLTSMSKKSLAEDNSIEETDKTEIEEIENFDQNERKELDETFKGKKLNKENKKKKKKKKKVGFESIQ